MHRHLATLKYLGFVDQDRQTECYRLAPKLALRVYQRPWLDQQAAPFIATAGPNSTSRFRARSISGFMGREAAGVRGIKLGR